MIAETYPCCYCLLPMGAGLPQVLQAALQLGQQAAISD